MNKLLKFVSLATIAGLFAYPVVLASAISNTSNAVIVPVPPFHQPHLDAALKLLKDARQELSQADADKTGHRAAAIRATDTAIKHTEQGIKLAVD